MDIKLCLYTEYAVMRDGTYIGSVTCTAARALEVAQAEYGTGIIVRHLLSMPEKDRIAYGVPVE